MEIALMPRQSPQMPPMLEKKSNHVIFFDLSNSKGKILSTSKPFVFSLTENCWFSKEDVNNSDIPVIRIVHRVSLKTLWGDYDNCHMQKSYHVDVNLRERGENLTGSHGARVFPDEEKFNPMMFWRRKIFGTSCNDILLRNMLIRTEEELHILVVEWSWL